MSPEPKKISREDTPTSGVAPSESAPVRVLSSDDSMVADLIKEQPDLEKIKEIASVVTHKQPDLLELPEECAALHKKQYRFAWLTKGRDLSATLRSNGWILCNRTNSPFIKTSRFGAHGAVEQAGMLLAFQPENLWQARQKGFSDASAARVKHYTKDIYEHGKDDPIHFYKPEEKDDE
jgi:hypothetical protein